MLLTDLFPARLLRLSAVLLVLFTLAGLAPSGAGAQSLPMPTVPGTSDTSGSSDTANEGEGETSGDSALRAKLLADILKDERARQALIDQLEQLANPQSPAAEAAAPQEEEDQSLARQLADATKGAAEASYGVVERLFRDLKGLGALAKQAGDLDWGALQVAILRLFGTIAVTGVGLVVFSYLLQKLTHLVTRRISGPHAVVRSIAFVVETLADILALAIAYAVGSGLAVGVFGDGGQMQIEQSLYLNAFLIVGGVRVFLRAIVASTTETTSLIPYREGITDYAYARLMVVAALLITGIAFLVPVVNTSLSFVAGRGLRVTVMLVAAFVALTSMRTLAARIKERRDPDTQGMGGQVVTMFVQLWPWIGTLYVLAVLSIGITRPYLLVSFVVGASVRTAVAIGIGVALVALVKLALQRGVRLPQWMAREVPVLERRMNTLIPAILKIVRTLVIVAVILAIIDAWQVLDISGWISTERGADLVARVISALIIVVVTYLLWIGISSWIEHRLNYGKQGAMPSARARTILSLMRNGLSITLFVIAGMLALSQLGVNIGPLLAGAGVLGLAVGFGSQKLVQDVITGAFIQFENAINEGDVVTVAGISGVVEKLTVRSVGIRDLAGVYHIVPFSSVDAVSNSMRKFAYHLAEVGVAYRENIREVKEAMREAFDRLKASEYGTDIIDDFEMHGVTALADSAVMVRGRIKTLPGSQWAVGRAYTEIMKEVFDERDIEIPFPHRTLYLGVHKDGHIDTLPIAIEEQARRKALEEAAKPQIEEKVVSAGGEKKDGGKKDEKSEPAQGSSASEPYTAPTQDLPAEEGQAKAAALKAAALSGGKVTEGEPFADQFTEDQLPDTEDSRKAAASVDQPAEDEAAKNKPSGEKPAGAGGNAKASDKTPASRRTSGQGAKGSRSQNRSRRPRRRRKDEPKLPEPTQDSDDE